MMNLIWQKLSENLMILAQIILTQYQCVTD